MREKMGKPAVSTLRLELSPEENLIPGKPKTCAAAKASWTRTSIAEKTSTVRIKIGPDGNLVEDCAIQKTGLRRVTPAIPVDSTDKARGYIPN